MLVLGLGNPLLGDDSVGLRVAARVRERLTDAPGVEVALEEAGGLRLMERLTGYDRAVLVDAAVTGAAPGTIRRLSPDDLPTQRTAAAHGIDLPHALALGRQLGQAMPSEVRIVAIEAESVLEFREDMTAAVAAAVEPAVDAVLEELATAPAGGRPAGPAVRTKAASRRPPASRLPSAPPSRRSRRTPRHRARSRAR
jgi:hydrogenase maturation protease